MTFYLVGTNETDALTDPDGGQFSTIDEAIDYAAMKTESLHKSHILTYALKIFKAEITELEPVLSKAEASNE